MSHRYWFRCTQCGCLAAFDTRWPSQGYHCGRCETLQPLRNVVTEVGGRDLVCALTTAPVPVVVAFVAPRCGPCRTIEPALELWARQYAGRLLALRLDVDRHPQAAASFDVCVVPTMALWHRQKRLALVEGARDLTVLRDTLRLTLESEGLAEPVSTVA